MFERFFKSWIAGRVEKLVVLACSLILTGFASSGVSAQDWTGAYLGGHGGESWSDTHLAGQIAEAPRLASSDFDGGFRGIHAGIIFAHGPFLMGVEGDFSWGQFEANINSRALERSSLVLVNNDARASGSASVTRFALNDLYSIRARLGFAFDRFIPYGTIGIARSTFDLGALTKFVENGGNTSVIDVSPVALTDDVTGVVYGGGAEWRIWQNLSLRAEVLHYDFERAKLYGIAPNSVTISGGADVGTTVVRGGASWLFR